MLGIRNLLPSDMEGRRLLEDSVSLRADPWEGMPVFRRATLAILAAFIAQVPFIAQSAVQVRRFSDIAWGAESPAIKSGMASAGLVFKESDADGDLLFEGSFSGYSAAAHAFLNRSGGLCKLQIELLPPEGKALRAFQEINEATSRRYGKPTGLTRAFEQPYYDGDGNEEQAVRAGMATIEAYWDRDPSNDGTAIAVSVTDKISIDISYESSAWPDEAKRRPGKRN